MFTLDHSDIYLNIICRADHPIFYILAQGSIRKEDQDICNERCLTIEV